MIKRIKKEIFRNPPLILLTFVLLILPFLNGGTSPAAKLILFSLPLPLLLFAIAQSKTKIKTDSLFWLSFLFLILSFVSLFFSTSLSLSLPAFALLLSFFIIFHLSRVIITSKKDLKLVFGAVLIAGLGLSLLSLWYLLPFTVKPTGSLNLVFIKYGHNHLAEYLPFVLFPSLFLFLKGEKKEKLIFGILTGFFFLVLILTFSRTSLLFFPLILGLIFYKQRLAIKKKLKPLIFLLIVLPLLFLSGILIFSHTEFGYQVASEGNRDYFLNSIAKPLPFEKRVVYWQQAWQGFLQRPFLGWGLGTFRLISLRFRDLPIHYSTYTHNFYLQILVELGLFGFLFYLGFLFKALKKVFLLIVKRKDPLLIGIFWALIFSCLQSVLDFGWHFLAIALTFLVLLGALTNEKIK